MSQKIVGLPHPGLTESIVKVQFPLSCFGLGGVGCTMKLGLKFRDVIHRGRLDPDRVQYVLKHLSLAMPEAGSQGRHRVFTVRQAVQLVIATHLAGGGIPVKFVGPLVSYCERTVRKARTSQKARTKASSAMLFYHARDGEHWFLEIRDGRWALCWQQVQEKQEKGPRAKGIRIPFRTARAYFEIRGDQTAVKSPVPLIRQLLDLTELEAAIAQPE